MAQSTATDQTDKLPETQIPKERKLNVLIKPTDKDWILVETEFKKLLSNTYITYTSILEEYFNEHDQKLFWPVVKPQSLADVQRNHTQRYQRLLGGRFRGHNVSMATKLAMLYFGLPIEPVMSAIFDPARYLVDAPDDDGLQEVEVSPPLHFLTAHDQRNWGLDWRRGREAAFSTVPVPVSTLQANKQSLHLRGGGTDDDDDDDDKVEDSESDDEDDDSDVIMLYAHEPTQNLGSSKHPLRLRGGAGDGDGGSVDGGGGDDGSEAQLDPPDPNRIAPEAVLHGYQGRIPIDIRKKQEAETAIRDLLAVRSGSTCDVVAVLYATDSNKLIRTETFAQPVSAYSELLDYIAEHNVAQGVGWFIYRVGEQPPGRLVPTSTDLIIEVSHGDSGQDRVAYLRMPTYFRFFSVDAQQGTLERFPFGLNDYMPFFKTAQDVLLGRPGFGAQGPHALVSFANQDKSIMTSANQAANTSWHGGLEIDVDFHAWLPDTWIGTSSSSCSLLCNEYADKRQVVFLVPGSKRQGTYLTSPPGYTDALDSLKNLRDECFKGKNIHAFRIWHGIDCLDVETSDSRRTPIIWDQQDGQDEGEFTTLLTRFLTTGAQFGSHRGYFFWVQPLYAKTGDGTSRTTTCTISQRGYSATSEPFDEELSTAQAFQKIVLRLKNQNESTNISELDSQDRIILYSTDLPPDSWNQNRFVFSSSTADAEMTRIRRLIPGQTVEFFLSDRTADFVHALDVGSQTVFGPRYGMIEGLRQNLGLNSLPPSDGPLVRGLKKQWEYQKRKRQLEEEGRNPEYLQGPAKRLKPSTGPVRARKDMRVESWSKKLSIYDSGAYNPSIPINAPPVEKILRPAGSTPMVSLGVLTPTEQRRLQESFHDLRNQTLIRNFLCHYDDCNFQYRSDDYRAIRDHLDKVHKAAQCPWCKDPLYEHWNAEQKNKHFREQHGDALRDVVGTPSGPDSVPNPAPLRQGPGAPGRSGTNGVSSLMRPTALQDLHPKRPLGHLAARQPPARAHRLEKEYRSCDRCGRDHGYLSQEADRKHHDNLCVPHAKGAGQCTFCLQCGLHVWGSKEAARKWDPLGRETHECRGLNEFATPPYCTKCGLSLGSFSDEYVSRHHQMCGGFASEVGTFCPYCQERLNDTFMDRTNHLAWIQAKRDHIVICRRMNVDKESRLTQASLTPFDIYDKGYWAQDDLPVDDLWDGTNANPDNKVTQSKWASPDFLSSNLGWCEYIGPNKVTGMPLTCPVGSCGVPLVGLLPRQVLAHFESKHGGPLEACPICELSFIAPEQHKEPGESDLERKYQVRHLECHVFGLWDVLNGTVAASSQPARDVPVPVGHPLWNPFEEGLDKRHKRCPFFDECGAMVGFMTSEQWARHAEAMHGGGVASGGLNDVETEAQRNIARETFRRLNEANKQQQPQQPQQPQQAPGSETQNSRQIPSPLPLDPQQPIGDWWCSRCFRKAPQKDVKGGPTREEMWAAHTDPTKSCRTQGQLNATVFSSDFHPPTASVASDRYEEAIVPNGVGWLSKAEKSRVALDEFKKLYHQKHQGYDAKIVPTKSHYPWTDDPNNDANKGTWTENVAPPFNADAYGDDDDDDEDGGDKDDDDNGKAADG